MRWLSTCVLFILAFTGCGEFEKLDLHPLKGTVTRLGEPVKDGGLIFLPENPGKKTFTLNASVRDGAFEAVTDRTTASGKTRIEPGALAGRYKPVYHPASDGSKANLEVELEPIEVVPGGALIKLELPETMPKGKGQPRDDAPAGNRSP